MSIRMEVCGVHVDPATQQPLLLLRSAAPAGAPGAGVVLPLWVGATEANAIALALEGIASPRPMTHDLLCSMVAALGATVREVAIVDVEDATYLAEIRLVRGGGLVAVDSRPSDAVAVAARLGVPVVVEQAVLDHASSHDVGSTDPEKLAAWFADAGDPGREPAAG